jgi:hypothetical protein
MSGNRKIAIEKLKTTRRLKKYSLKHSTNQNHRRNLQLRLLRPQTQHKEPEQFRYFLACR